MWCDSTKQYHNPRVGHKCQQTPQMNSLVIHTNSNESPGWSSSNENEWMYGNKFITLQLLTNESTGKNTDVQPSQLMRGLYSHLYYIDLH